MYFESERQSVPLPLGDDTAVMFVYHCRSAHGTCGPRGQTGLTFHIQTYCMLYCLIPECQTVPSQYGTEHSIVSMSWHVSSYFPWCTAYLILPLWPCVIRIHERSNLSDLVNQLDFSVLADSLMNCFNSFSWLHKEWENEAFISSKPYQTLMHSSM